jgi:hypothetical protein
MMRLSFSCKTVIFVKISLHVEFTNLPNFVVIFLINLFKFKYMISYKLWLK